MTLATVQLDETVSFPLLLQRIQQHIQDDLMVQVKIIAIDKEMGIVLPQEALAKLGAKEGDTIDLIECPDGLMLTPTRNILDKQIQAAKRVMKQYRHALHELAQ